ncbi:helix-turn-helix domain-containing protein [Aurantibacter sp.]|uniref:helix-turn-helix domain-containing protein n=1 Tax=Aurantibacter sp. TaxID=2807103 RepID=UPI0035C7FB62
MINKEINIASNFINNTDRNIFLTGKAGTGKTTFLHKLKESSLKRMVIVAPTGVAAINAKGVTIHSFFQMPFGPIIPNQELDKSSSFNRKFTKTKINIIKSLDLLVIDEISMVRADLLDGVDKTLRRFRNKNLVFGGVQLLMIGDLQQLSPVLKDNDWSLLKPFYRNVFFFSSHAFLNCNPITVELKHIYRQANPTFIEILNEIRTNSLTQASADELNKRYNPDFDSKVEEGYISLTTHNNKAELTNQSKLELLKGKSIKYKALIEGKFPESSYPNKEELVLKVGAQVMFVKNDSSQDKRYFNGKIGKVISLEKDKVIVKCPEDSESISTTLETWENITYSVNSSTKEINEEKIGSFTQMPLRLAWSITIHKSQGLTFEKAIIDAENAFAHGQTYVALSRCKNLEGLVLKSKITSNQIITDSNVISFNQQAEENQPTEQDLENSKSDFQLKLISEIFDFYSFLYPVNRLLDIFYKNRDIIIGDIEPILMKAKNGITNLLKVANGFKFQLKELALDSNAPENNINIQDRFKKALNYYKNQLNDSLVEPFKNLKFETDNKAIEHDLEIQLDAIDEFITIKQLYFNAFDSGFDVKHFLKLRARAVFLAKEKPKKARKKVLEGTSNVELAEILRQLRNQIAKDNNLVHFQVFTQKALYEMSELLPTHKNELANIIDMGKTRIEKYGTQILKAINDFCFENNIETFKDEELFEAKKTKHKKGDSNLLSLELYKSGKSIDQIAMERELNQNTIFGHLAKFIPTGEIKITDLVPDNHYKVLLKVIPKLTFENISDLKHQLDDKYSYGEIKLVLDELNNM